MGKARRVATTNHTQKKLNDAWQRRQPIPQPKGKTMTDEQMIETFARMWMQCDPNRGGADPDEIQPDHYVSGGVGSGGVVSEKYDNPQAGQPRWKWFIPRAEASLEFLRTRGVKLS